MGKKESEEVSLSNPIGVRAYRAMHLEHCLECALKPPQIQRFVGSSSRTP